MTYDSESVSCTNLHPQLEQEQCMLCKSLKVLSSNWGGVERSTGIFGKEFLISNLSRVPIVVSLLNHTL